MNIPKQNPKVGSEAPPPQEVLMEDSRHPEMARHLFSVSLEAGFGFDTFRASGLRAQQCVEKTLSRESKKLP